MGENELIGELGELIIEIEKVREYCNDRIESLEKKVAKLQKKIETQCEEKMNYLELQSLKYKEVS